MATILKATVPGAPQAAEPLAQVLAQARACTLCAPVLPLGPNPIVRLSSALRILLVSQAPGAIAHRKSIPYLDPSGTRLRDWLGVDEATFYESGEFGILPMGFCYPGRAGGGDAPPRPECAPTWHRRLLAAAPVPRLTVLIGAYAQAGYLGERRAHTLTDTVRAMSQHLARGVAPLPHPSPRNNVWLARNGWFEAEALPLFRAAVAAARREP